MGPTAVSPDGRWLYYQVAPKGWRLTFKRGEAVFRTPAAGGSREKIADDSQHHWVACARAPSATCVVVESDETQLSVYSLDPQNGRGRKLTSMPLSSAAPADISPDGSRVAVQLLTEGRIRVLSLTGEAPRDVVIAGHHLDGGAFYWSADAAGWYVSSTPDAYPGSTELLHVDMNGRIRVMLRQNVRDLMSAIPSPDGRQIAITGASTLSNAWMLRGF
jgi:Tol biopolymer transport system component